MAEEPLPPVNHQELQALLHQPIDQQDGFDRDKQIRLNDIKEVDEDSMS